LTDLLSPALSSRGGEGDVEPMRGFFSLSYSGGEGWGEEAFSSVRALL